jgi:hypothetical protein
MPLISKGDDHYVMDKLPPHRTREEVEELSAKITNDIIRVLEDGEEAALNFQQEIYRIKEMMSDTASTDYYTLCQNMLGISNIIPGSYGFAHVLVKTIHEAGFAIPTPWYCLFPEDVDNISIDETGSDLVSINDGDQKTNETHSRKWHDMDMDSIITNVVSTHPSNQRERVNMGWLVIMTISREILDQEQYSNFCESMFRLPSNGIQERQWALLFGYKNKSAKAIITAFNARDCNINKIPPAFTHGLSQPQEIPISYSVLRERIRCALTNMQLRVKNNGDTDDKRSNRYSSCLTSYDCISWMSRPLSDRDARIVFGPTLDVFISLRDGIDPKSLNTDCGRSTPPAQGPSSSVITPGTAEGPNVGTAEGPNVGDGPDTYDRWSEFTNFPCSCEPHSSRGKLSTNCHIVVFHLPPMIQTAQIRQ